MKKRILAAALVLMMLFTAAALSGCKLAATPKATFIAAANVAKRADLSVFDKYREFTHFYGELTLNKLSVMGTDSLSDGPITVNVDSATDGSINSITKMAIKYAGEELTENVILDDGAVYLKIDTLMEKYAVIGEAQSSDDSESFDADLIKELRDFIGLLTSELQKSLESIDEAKFTKDQASFEVNGVKSGKVTVATLTLSPEDVERLVRDYASKITDAKECKDLCDTIGAMVKLIPNKATNEGEIVTLPAATLDDYAAEFKSKIAEALDDVFAQANMSAAVKVYIDDGEAIGCSVKLDADGKKDGQPTGEKAAVTADILTADGKTGAAAEIVLNIKDVKDGADVKPVALSFYKDGSAIKGDLLFQKDLTSDDNKITAEIDMTSEDGEYYKGFAKFDMKNTDDEGNAADVSAKLNFGFSHKDGKTKIDTESLMISRGLPITLPLKINAEITETNSKIDVKADVSVNLQGMVDAAVNLELKLDKEQAKAEAPKSVYTEEELSELDLFGKLKEKYPKIYGLISSFTVLPSGNDLFGGGDGEVTGSASYVSNGALLDIINYSDDSNHYSFAVQGKLEFEDGWVTVSALDFSEKLTFEGDPEDVSGAQVKIGGKSYYSMYYDTDDDASNGYEIIYYRNTDDGPQVAFERIIRIEEFGTFEFDTLYATFFSPAENNEWVINDFGKGLGIKTVGVVDGEGAESVEIEYTYPAGGTEKSVVEVFKTADDQGDMIRFINNETETEIYWDSEEGYAEIYFYADFTIENGMMNIFYQPEAQFALPFTDLGGGAVRIGDDTFTVSRKSDGEDDYTEYYIASESEVHLNDLYFVVFDDGSGYAGICCDLKMLQADELGDNAYLFELKYGSAGSTKVIIEELGEGAYNFRFILAEGEEYAEIFLDVPIMGVEDE